MAKVTVTEWDPAEYIETKEAVIAYLEAAPEENDVEFLLETIGHIARSKGMVQIAREMNLNRKGLYKAFSEKGNPSLLTGLRRNPPCTHRLRPHRTLINNPIIF